MSIPDKYEPELIETKSREDWLGFSLDYYTDPNVWQVPYLDLTIQLDVTDAYAAYQKSKVPGATFFAFLVWNLSQTLQAHPSFNLRFIEKKWYLISNPPIFTPVAVGGKERFRTVIFENVSKISYEEFISIYASKISEARNGQGKQAEPLEFYLSHFLGNLPKLQFSGLTLHWRPTDMVGQPILYFGKRYVSGSSLFIPLAAKIHHGCADPFVFELFLSDFQKRWVRRKVTDMPLVI
jgi:chloramphenicol O-acetyltransferase